MKNNNKIFYYTSTGLNIALSLGVVLTAIFDLTSTSDNIALSIVLLCIGSVFAIISTLLLINSIKKEEFTLDYAKITLIVTSGVSLVCAILLILDLRIWFYILFGLTYITSTVFQVIGLSHDNGKIRYNHIRRSQRLAPTHTIQISTEYLVKDSYTPEEAEKTLEQLYSIHDQKGFSIEDFEAIKERILNNVEHND